MRGHRGFPSFDPEATQRSSVVVGTSDENYLNIRILFKWGLVNI